MKIGSSLHGIIQNFRYIYVVYRDSEIRFSPNDNRVLEQLKDGPFYFRDINNDDEVSYQDYDIYQSITIKHDFVKLLVDPNGHNSNIRFTDLHLKLKTTSSISAKFADLCNAILGGQRPYSYSVWKF